MWASSGKTQASGGHYRSGKLTPMSDQEQPEREVAPTPAVVATLVANHREFLAFVQRRVGDRAQAEEILQEAFVRSIAKADTIRDSAVAWFYRVLRNAIIDHQR